MSDENYKVQWSVSLPPAAQYAKGDMLNIRGETVGEINALLDDITASEFVDKATEVANLIRLAASLGADVQTDAAPAHGYEPAQQSAPAESAPLYTCVHGKRTQRNGTNARGAWTGYFCPLKKGDPAQCEPVWAD